MKKAQGQGWPVCRCLSLLKWRGESQTRLGNKDCLSCLIGPAVVNRDSVLRLEQSQQTNRLSLVFYKVGLTEFFQQKQVCKKLIPITGHKRPNAVEVKARERSTLSNGPLFKALALVSGLSLLSRRRVRAAL
eukprot:1106457-Pelagomonas_calceolata.AAC.1